MKAAFNPKPPVIDDVEFFDCTLEAYVLGSGPEIAPLMIQIAVDEYEFVKRDLER